MLVAMGSLPSSVLAGDLVMRISVGSSFQSRNDIQIPNSDLGTRFSLTELAGEGPVSAARIEINWSMNERHGFRVLLAPLSYSKTVTIDQPVLFMEQAFNTESDVDASYKFNSWRLGYHYTLKQTTSGSFRIGGTLKVRDAEIRLEQGDTVGATDNIGLVPLFYAAGQYRLNSNWTIGADVDGLAGGRGRAIDAGVTLDYSLSPDWRIGGDVRILDGGVDSDENYNFALFYSAALAIQGRF